MAHLANVPLILKGLTEHWELMGWFHLPYRATVVATTMIYGAAVIKCKRKARASILL